ncbi:MAG: toxin-antitoxin system HicB family antitoxin [Dethiobacter sp.]|nr:MAG: toxin-antitoxin system HicB family antitoxin [Dethiobacter sp.]
MSDRSNYRNIERDRGDIKQYKGTFNVRINPKLHREAVRRAIMNGVSLNEFVENAIREGVKDK